MLEQFVTHLKFVFKIVNKKMLQHKHNILKKTASVFLLQISNNSNSFVFKTGNGNMEKVCIETISNRKTEVVLYFIVMNSSYLLIFL